MTPDPRYESFGAAVAVRRDQIRMTQARLAERVGLSRASIANIERGRQSVLLHQAIDLAAALGLQLTDLLPPTRPSSLEDQAFALSDAVSPAARAQISSLIANAVAAGRPRS